MNDFGILDKFGPLDEIDVVTECKHTSRIIEKSTLICTDCGEEMDKDIFLDNTLYLEIQIKQDVTRCHIRKSEEKNIYKDVEDMGFGECIVSVANEIYLEVTQGKIYRGNSRKAIVFACIFNAYKINGNPQNHDDLMNMFNLKRKSGLKGMKHVNNNVSKDSLIKSIYITPVNIIREIMKKFNANPDNINEVIEMYHFIKDKSSIINRARPQSTSAGLVYYYILKTQKPITLKDFLREIKLSELTIKKIVKELDKIFQTNYFLL